MQLPRRERRAELRRPRRRKCPRRLAAGPFRCTFGNRNTGNIEAAKARELQAETSLRLKQREIERKLREHATAYELHRKEMARWNPKIAGQLREAAVLANRHYRLGAVPLTTYLEVQSSYLDALEAIYATQADALTARAELELLTGTKLTTP